MSFIEDLKNVFRNKDNGLIKIIVINGIVFLLINIVLAIFKLSGFQGEAIAGWLALPSSLSLLPLRFWTIITYMFLHTDLMHIVFNMIWLYSMGKIFVEYLGSKRLVSTYLLGGISGGVLFVLSYNLIPALNADAYLLGASAGVMAVVVAIATLIPDYSVHLLFFGPIRLKYIALIAFLLTTVLDLTANTGGKIAHLGGALFGYMYIVQYKKGKDIAKGFNDFLHKISSFSFAKKSKLKVAHKRSISDEEYNMNKISNQEVIDAILDKISKSGYESLSKKEKEILFKVSSDKDRK